MPASPVSIRVRHTLLIGRDVVGHWRHNGVRWPVVVLGLVTLAGLVLLTR